MNGNGVEINYKKAMKWLKKAANQGNAVAMHNLGVLYYHGLGTSVDMPKANMFINMSRSSADVDSPVPIDLSARTVDTAGVLMNL